LIITIFILRESDINNPVVSRMTSKIEEIELEDKEVWEAYLQECWMTVLSVLRRALFTVERYAQVYCVDMNDRGLKVVMKSEVEEVNKGVRLTVDFIADEQSVLKAVKNRQFRKVIKQMEREMKRIKKARVYGGKKA